MKISKAGLDLLKVYEQGPHGGFARKAYKCSGGVWTIAWGHTRGVKEGDTCTAEQADAYLLDDVAFAEGAVNRLVEVPLTQPQFDALVCLVFNIGAGAFAGSTLLRLLNAGDYTGAANQFPRWNKSKGVILNGLVARRADEKALFLTGIGV